MEVYGLGLNGKGIKSCNTILHDEVLRHLPLSAAPCHKIQLPSVLASYNVVYLGPGLLVLYVEQGLITWTEMVKRRYWV